MASLLTERSHIVNGIVPVADAFAGTVASDVVKVSDYHKVRFILYKGVGTTGTSTLTVVPCDDAAASTSGTAVHFNYVEITSTDVAGAMTKAATVTTSAGSNTMMIIDVDCDEIAASGYEYCYLNCVEVANDPVLGGVLIELYEPRYAGDGSATVLT